MTIKKGEDWGGRGRLPPDAPIVSGDRQLSELFTIRRAPELRLDGPTHVGLLSATLDSADLARTVSARGTADELRSGERTQLPIDLTIVTVDEADHVMSASLVIRRPLWLGVVEGAMNASFLGEWNVTPSGHPNDGRLDVVRAELTAGDRWKALSRLDSGTHVPHPGIAIRRLKSHEFSPDGRSTIRIDGRDVGHADRVTFTVVPDAVTIVI